MIESGSLTPGVSAADFGLAPFTAMRVEMPRPDLADYVSSYHVFDSDPPPEALGCATWELPAGAMIRFALTENPMSAALRRQTYDPIPEAGLWGPTSQAKEWITSGGVTIGAALTPLGWAALFKQPASSLRDLIAPLDTVMPPRAVGEIVAALRQSDQSFEVKDLLDGFFTAQLRRPVKDEEAIRQLAALLDEREPRGLRAAAAELGTQNYKLRRIADRYFGFSPKLLQSRTRFLRTIVRMLLKNEPDHRAVTSLYYDASHFLRDAHRFLGMTPRQFMAKETDYLRAGLRAHAAVLRAAREQREKGAAAKAA